MSEIRISYVSGKTLHKEIMGRIFVFYDIIFIEDTVISKCDSKSLNCAKGANPMTNEQLILEAKKARERAYTPYSHFQVGAVLVGKSGKLYYGCNIENAAYTPTNCAERTAFFKAVSEGELEFEKIAIVGGPEGTEADTLCAPCGVCRQVMMEFCDPETFTIIMPNGKDKWVEMTLKELLPYGFGPANLKKD